jgi:hypothetical protein
VLLVHLAPLPGTEPSGSFGTHDSRGDYGFALYLGIMPQGGATLEQAAGPKHYLMKPPCPAKSCYITVSPAGKKNR